MNRKTKKSIAAILYMAVVCNSVGFIGNSLNKVTEYTCTPPYLVLTNETNFVVPAEKHLYLQGGFSSYTKLMA